MYPIFFRPGMRACPCFNVARNAHQAAPCLACCSFLSRGMLQLSVRGKLQQARCTCTLQFSVRRTDTATSTLQFLSGRTETATCLACCSFCPAAQKTTTSWTENCNKLVAVFCPAGRKLQRATDRHCRTETARCSKHVAVSVLQDGDCNVLSMLQFLSCRTENCNKLDRKLQQACCSFLCGRTETATCNGQKLLDRNCTLQQARCSFCPVDRKLQHAKHAAVSVLPHRKLCGRTATVPAR